MSNAVEEFLHALKRTINGDPYPDLARRQYAPLRYRIASMRDLREGLLLSGKYLIQKRIGKGAMATVYKAVQQPIDRVVAIKILNTRYSQDPVNVRRFNREAKTLSNLKHRNILSIHDLGNTEDGQPFMVMEYLDGITLEGLIAKRGAIPIARAIPLFCQVCEGMAYAHKRGVVHRDIKPGNVMVVKDDDDGSDLAKLVDFGIVKLDPNSQNVSQKLTLTGEIWGSPVYMSPEQCMGNELDARSDIYSFGLVMYEALLAVPAFQGQSIGKIISKQLGEMPPFFKDVDAQLKIPEKLEEIVFRAIRKKPEDRFASMDELYKELEAFARQFRIRLKGTSSTKLNSEYYRTIAEPEPVAAVSVQTPEPARIAPVKNAAEQLRSNAAQDAAGYESSAGISKGKIKLLIAFSSLIVALGVVTVFALGGIFFASKTASPMQNNAKAPSRIPLPGMPITKLSAGGYPSTHEKNFGENASETKSITSGASGQNSASSLLSTPHANLSRDNKATGPSDDNSAKLRDNTPAHDLQSNNDAGTDRGAQAAAAEKIKVQTATNVTSKNVRTSSKKTNTASLRSAVHKVSSEPSDEELEKILVKRRRLDSTQSWLDLKNDMHSP